MRRRSISNPLASLLLCAAVATAQEYRQLGTALDGAGRPATNTVVLNAVAWRHVSAIAQPGGVGTCAGGAWCNSAGFLHAAHIVQPWRDSDGDGVADELETDNDDDGLSDMSEVTGTSFDPVTPTLANVADSDGDGQPDGAEAEAGTDPKDAEANLRIVSVGQHGGDMRIGWRARGGYSYRLLHADSLWPLEDFTPLAVTTAVGGVSPWYVTTNLFADPVVTPVRFYRVETVP